VRINSSTAARFSGEVAAVSKYQFKSGCFSGFNSCQTTRSPAASHSAVQALGVRNRLWLGSRSFSTWWIQASASSSSSGTEPSINDSAPPGANTRAASRKNAAGSLK
jgi:hypothetical protein